MGNPKTHALRRRRQYKAKLKFARKVRMSMFAFFRKKSWQTKKIARRYVEGKWRGNTRRDSF